MAEKSRRGYGGILKSQAFGQMMRIAFLVTGLSYGGAETQVVQLATRLKQRGWEVLVITLRPPGAAVEHLKSERVEFFSLNIRRKVSILRAFIILVRVIRNWHPHIMHSHMVHANILARLVKPVSGVPILICTAHNIDERGKKGSGKLRIFLYRVTDSLCDLTTQVSQAGVERYIRIKAVSRSRIYYIPNGVDVELFRPNVEIRKKLRDELGLNKETFMWLAAGRFEPQKDYPVLFRAFALVVSRRPEAQLFIAGEGFLRGAMEKLVKDLGIDQSVRFLGFRRDLPQLMNAADAYVMSSAWEGLPMVLLEAQATGLPVVATDVGGNGEVILHEKTGFLAPPKNPEALAEAMLKLMALPEEERRRMGEAARQHIQANFSLDKVVDQWEALYRELLTKKGIWV